MVQPTLHRHYDRNGPARAGYCFTDFPDSDLNLSCRLQQLTSLKVDPDGRVLSLNEPELFDSPLGINIIFYAMTH